MSWIVKLNTALRITLAWLLFKVVARVFGTLAAVVAGCALAFAGLGLWMHPKPMDLVPVGLDEDDIE